MNTIARYLIILMFFGVAVQATYRVLRLAVGSDEITFIEDVQRPGHQRMFFTREAPTLGNPQHHFSKQFLAALLAEPCVRFLPIDEITAARLPALLGMVLYLWGVWKLKDNFTPGWQQVVVVLALVGNAFLLDFFSVARGYGLAMGCTALSLSFLMRADTIPGQANRALWWAAVAMLSCLAFLYFYVAVCAVLWWMKWRKAPGLTDFGWFWSAIFSMVMVAVFCLPRILYSMRASYILEQGGYVVQNGFFGETLLPLLNCCLYGTWWAAGMETSSATLSPWSATTLMACGWTIVGLVAGLGVYGWREKNHPAQMLVGIMVAVFGLLELAHWGRTHPVSARADKPVLSATVRAPHRRRRRAIPLSLAVGIADRAAGRRDGGLQRELHLYVETQRGYSIGIAGVAEKPREHRTGDANSAQ